MPLSENSVRLCVIAFVSQRYTKLPRDAQSKRNHIINEDEDETEDEIEIEKLIIKIVPWRLSKQKHAFGEGTERSSLGVFVLIF